MAADKYVVTNPTEFKWEENLEERFSCVSEGWKVRGSWNGHDNQLLKFVSSNWKITSVTFESKDSLIKVGDTVRLSGVVGTVIAMDGSMAAVRLTGDWLRLWRMDEIEKVDE